MYQFIGNATLSISPSTYFSNLPISSIHGRKGCQLQIVMEEGPNSRFSWKDPKLSTLLNLLRCHGIKKGNHVWWYEVVFMC